MKDASFGFNMRATYGNATGVAEATWGTKLDGTVMLHNRMIHQSGLAVGNADAVRYIERDLTDDELEHLVFTYGADVPEGLKVKVYL